jgi:hypothetical protein
MVLLSEINRISPVTTSIGKAKIVKLVGVFSSSAKCFSDNQHSVLKNQSVFPI